MTGSDFGGAFAGLAFMFFGACLLIPFGLWKLVEVVVWLFKHINISVT